MNQSDSRGFAGQPAGETKRLQITRSVDDSLRTRIAAVLVEFFKSDHEGFVNEYEPCDDDGNPCGGTLLRIDSVLDPQSLADAVIRELQLEIDYGSTYDVGGVTATSYRYISKWWVAAND